MYSTNGILYVDLSKFIPGGFPFEFYNPFFVYHFFNNLNLWKLHFTDPYKKKYLNGSLFPITIETDDPISIFLKKILFFESIG
ncbi:hypothetical protein DQM68_11170 [Leptospira mayottensis]|uniref:Uncharacterized protein n=2 Tax=Leptospira mayottensis TaxID=1137606 RepID=A0AA87MRL3_9LEPT|nr:hypothetical protein DQM68_11170 [Leptospira mayottensis]AXR66231.1 hypothetical protein DQM28_16570 [Leptospira mayottensis]AZQ03806.1 hypothetical protein LEP1GSC190_10530 [Leptospira mayottensis 200901116]EKS01373.1 hypothetical protein LEP1GSC125_0644 [Leptospira mayottensis 200901122]TGN03964.1 hypothetical protein EHR03_11520 [Leptospira mayottensis]